MICKCVRCGIEFEAVRKTAVCKDCHVGVCVVCGKEFQLQTPWTQMTCSSKCRGIYRKQSGVAKQAAEKAKKTVEEKYGVSNVAELQKFKKICKWCGKEFETTSSRREYCEDKHYGPCPVCGKQVEIKEMYVGPQACSEECRLKRIQATCLEKYGDVSSVNSEHGRELSRQTCLEKYGVDHYSKSIEYKEKFKSTMIERYGTTSALKNPDILNKLRSTCEKKYGVPFSCMTKECRSSYRTISKVNQAFEQRLAEHDIQAEGEFSIGRYSYDFRIGNILVEINPTITHNSYLSIFDGCDPMTSDYHIKKSQTASDNGFTCIHVWDWDDWDSIIKMLEPKTSIYARNCKLDIISKQVANKFTSLYHLSGSCHGQDVNYGLFYQGELVQVMTFGSPRYNHNYDFELLRLCTKSKVTVVGGASKMFHQFVLDNPSKSVISYCDASKFSGKVYQQLGMKLLRHTPPNKIWSKDNQYVTNNLLNQRGYDQLFNTEYGKGTSNEQLMLDNKWLPVYDCGQYVYEYVE